MVGASSLVAGVRPVVVAVLADGSDPLPAGGVQRIGTAGPVGPRVPAGILVRESARSAAGVAAVRCRIGSPGR
ncbi:hypothetical protein ABNF97_16345 [Plantactinospora sp. B6F1]|uniref:hypothetical protein n=1 Tax=Plantactinospora sp. B6F1 TaxID=3158971 RepID=UPI0032D8CEDD